MLNRLNRRIHTLILIALACVLLAGCRKQLYGSLSEEEANAVLAVLLEASIPAEKQAGDEGVFVVMVEESEFAGAVRVLAEHALPGQRFDNLGTVFGKNAMFSTPMEEKARYLYAMQEELSSTLSRIDGVLLARVHLVMPESDQMGRDLIPPSAAVFVKHLDDERHDPDMHRRQIRDLIAASVPKLDRDAIVVSFFPAVPDEAPSGAAPAWRTVLGIRVAESSAARLWWGAGIAGGLCLLFAALAAFAFARKSRR